MKSFVDEAVHGEEPGLQHFSHVHALQLFHVQYHGEAVCHACNRACPVGAAYRCASCTYYLDKTCAHTPQAIRHPGHPGHTLALLVAPTYADGSFSCDACGGRGTAFSFHCAACEFDLHISCANAPLQLHHHSHPHPLALAFSNPYGGTSFACDICTQIGAGSSWLYRCAPCGFDAHIGCATSPPQAQGFYHYQQQQRQEQQPQGQQPSSVPRSPLHSFHSQPPPQPPVNGPTVQENQAGAIDDAAAVQMMGVYMQQAKLQNQMLNNMFQMHQQRMASLPSISTWQVDGFMTPPKVPRPNVGGLMSTLMQNMTNMSLDAGNLIAAAAASPAVGASPLSGMLEQLAQGGAGFPRQTASNKDDFLSSFLKGNDSSGMANSQLNPLSGNPEEFLNNLLQNSDWIPKGYPGFDASTSLGGFGFGA